MAGVSAQEHVGDGHDGIVGNGAGLWWVEEEDTYLIRGRERRHDNRAMGLTNMEGKEEGRWECCGVEGIIILDSLSNQMAASLMPRGHRSLK
jgi:hypothetical protein